jgi:hypothetical protein
MPISDLGTPSEDHLFAVFDTPEEADRATQALDDLGVPVHRFFGSQDANALLGPDTDTGEVLATVRRVLRGFSEEAHEADRYGRHLQNGKVLLAMPAENRAVAELLTRVLTRNGGYDVTFFDNLTYEHLAPPTRQPASPEGPDETR